MHFSLGEMLLLAFSSGMLLASIAMVLALAAEHLLHRRWKRQLRSRVLRAGARKG